MFFKKSFNSVKCKTLLRLATSRIKLLRNMREVHLKQLKRELANLLEVKQEPSAHLKVENIYREQNIMAAYEIIELLCEQIATRLPIIEAQKQCPIDLREAVASIIYAAPRCSDIPELKKIRSLLSAKYGKEFTAIAAELKTDCGVNRVVTQKLSVSRPSVEVKLKLMKDIAAEYNLDWDPSALESQLLKPREDLLEGPSQFVGASQRSLQSSFEEPGYSKPISQQNQIRLPVEAQAPMDQRPVFSDERQFIPFVCPTIEVESPLSGSQSSSQGLTPQRQGGSGRASHVSLAPSFEYDEDEDALPAIERRKSFKNVVSAARKAAESAERAAAAARAAAAIADQNLAGSSTDSESDSDGNQATQLRENLVSSHLEPRRNPPFYDQAEEGVGVYRKQDSWNYPMHQVGPKEGRSASPSIISTGRYDDEYDDDDDNGGYDSVWHSESSHKSNQVNPQGLTSRLPSSNTQSYQHNNTSSFKRTLDTSGAAPIFDAYDWDDSNHKREHGGAPSIPVGPPARPPPDLLGAKAPSLTKSTSFTHPKLPDCDEITAHFQALKAMHKK